MGRNKKYTVIHWAAIEMELFLLGFGLSGKTCPISLIIEKALADKSHFSSEEIEIALEDGQAALVDRVFNERIVPLESLVASA